MPAPQRGPEEEAEQAAAEQLSAEGIEPDESAGGGRSLEPLDAAAPAGAVEGESIETETEKGLPPIHPEDYTSAAYARLGAEGLARLRARYAEVLARIAEKPLDEPVRDQLKLQAERLNPDGWVTSDEVTQGLEEYEAVFESLRAVVGHRHRRRRRR